MNNEKVKEIKKALECCTNNKGCEPCQRLSKKPYHLDDCRFVLLTDTLYLINELGSENERLNKALVDNLEAYKDGFNEGAGLKKGVDDKLKTENQQLKDRIAELENELEKEQINNLNCDTELQYKEKRIAELEEYIKGNEQDAKAFVNGWHKDLETELKQFAERLKEELKGIVGANFIDETLKEFINKGYNKDNG